MTTVSVIIPTFNRAEKLGRAVFSVLGQTYKGFELVVVDDGSTDETRERLLAFGDRVHVVTHETNRGVSAARNTGIRVSRGPLLAFLDSDDYWLPEKLEAQVEFLGEHPDRSICQTEEIWIRRGRRVNPGRKHLKPSGDIFFPSLERCLVSPSAVMLRRSLLDEVGFFDETLPVCEDYDLWLRIACRYPVDLIGRALLIKEGGREDQLSCRYKGMDVYRIKALLNLIGGGRLDGDQLESALEALSRKCRIYGNGCMKRGKETAKNQSQPAQQSKG